MDDATASDNCGEVTIEVSSETTAGDAAGNYVVRTFGHRRRRKRLLPRRSRSRHHCPEFTFVPADYRRVLRRDANGRRWASDNYGEVTIEIVAKRLPAMPQTAT